MREKNSFPLKPNDGHKSFYGKAIIKKMNNGLILKSYETNVAAFVNGRFIRLWNDYSVTTMRHVNAFAAYCGIREGGKAWWCALPVERI